MPKSKSRDNTAALANALWSDEPHKLQAAEFQKRFDAIYAVAQGPATLWQLGAAANDYLRHHPNSISVPPELAQALLVSHMVDARLTGLKLINRCSNDAHVIGKWICHALQSKKKKTELWGGICELINLLPRVQSQSEIPADDLRTILQKLRSSGDTYVRGWAERLVNWIDHIGTESVAEFEWRPVTNSSANTDRQN